MSRGRTIVFIDNSNIFMGQLDAHWRIDIKKLIAYMEKAGEVWQTFFFASVTEPPRFEQTNFYAFMKNEMRFNVEIYRLGRKTNKCKKCGKEWTTYVEKGVDVALATKLLTLGNVRAYDTAILAGADRDFLGTIQAVKSLGLRVEIFAWQGTISDEMRAESSSPVIYFDEIRKEIEFTGKPDEEAEKLSKPEGELE